LLLDEILALRHVAADHLQRRRRSMRVTVSTSPGRRKSRTICSSFRPCVVVPLRFSARMVSQAAARNAASWIDKS
jgi:hypothetical protein